MKRVFCCAAVVCLSGVAVVSSLHADAPEVKVLFSDDFERTESKPELEQVGNGWGTNSKSRAKGNKQVDLVDGAMFIVRHAEADHGVSVTQDVAFRDATISMRFKIGPKDDLGINIADMKEKSVHAGHICMAKVRLGRVEMTDLKTGRMDLGIRTRRLANETTEADKKAMKADTKTVPVKLDADAWHQLSVSIGGDTMMVTIDGTMVGQFTSPGIGHATKSRLRLAVNREALVDDVKITTP
ncbi:MAG: family 16 glycoside hydrolase [Rubripirellula sp.]